MFHSFQFVLKQVLTCRLTISNWEQWWGCLSLVCKTFWELFTTSDSHGRLHFLYVFYWKIPDVHNFEYGLEIDFSWGFQRVPASWLDHLDFEYLIHTLWEWIQTLLFLIVSFNFKKSIAKICFWWGVGGSGMLNQNEAVKEDYINVQQIDRPTN